ncbi:MAG TPA: NAD(P)H-dependent oxidoreductase [Candidatus Sulfotelmatobacter sp.]|nr:NAD(P)H-dependent oxidoreductase [Candidatus Sulfotelmatobacter sp.]
MNEKLKFLGLIGSLRKDSYNKALMKTSFELLPDNVTLEIFDLADFPLFNQDLMQNPPTIIREFKAKIRGSDAILIASPEYNYSIPGMLKNAIDWASRPPTDNAWDGKPAAIISASTGKLGGARMQYHLRQTFVFVNMYPINRPEFMLANARNYFDEAGNLKDEDTRKRLQELLQALADWTQKLKSR